MVTLKEAKVLLKKYADAWVNRDPDAIIKIFEPDAEYWETAFARLKNLYYCIGVSIDPGICIVLQKNPCFLQGNHE